MSEASAHTDSLGVYLHAPFCAVRRDYYDFNTYTPGQLGSNAMQGDYLDATMTELGMAVVRHLELARDADTVLVGDGTPSMSGASGLRRLLDGVRNSFGLTGDAEVTTESNPEPTSPEFFEGLTETGFTHMSSGIRSVVPHVFATLDHTYTPGRPATAVVEARTVDFEHINLNVTYGTPGESIADLDTTLEVVLAMEADHVSAYSLIVEPGTAMAREVRRGELPMPDDDDLADRYERIGAILSQAGFSQHEVSSWAKPDGQCRRNMICWRDGNWWSADPDAHSHLDGTRFYNAKHPTRCAATISGGELPIKGSEELTVRDRHTEKIMLGLRLTEGIDANLLGESELGRARRQAEAGMTEFVFADGGQRIQLINRDRLLADVIIIDILS